MVFVLSWHCGWGQSKVEDIVQEVFDAFKNNHHDVQ